MMEKVELCLDVVLNLLKIKFGKDKISEPKIDISIMKTTGIDL